MVVHVLDALRSVEVDWTVIVVGHGAERLVSELNEHPPFERPLHYVEQAVQRGTGDATTIALNALPAEVGDDAEDADVVILPGDTPLLEAGTVAELVRQHRESGAAASLLTVRAPEPTGYGRIVRDDRGRVRRIVEERDATEEERRIDEVNTSVYCFRTSLLGMALRQVTDGNDQNEFYLTDAVQVLADAGHRVETLVAPDIAWAVGVNDRAQLAAAEAELRRRINDRWMRKGVTMVDPLTTYIDLDVVLDEDVCILPGTRLQGSTVIGRGAEIGPDVHLVDCEVGAGAVVRRTDGVGAAIGEGARVGPFVALQSGDEVAAGAVIGPQAHIVED